MGWLIAIGLATGMLIYSLTARAGIRNATADDVEYLARMLCMHTSLTEAEWVGLAWLVINRINTGRCETVRECVTSPRWSTNEERRRRLAAPSGYTDGSGKPAPPDSPRWREALELSERILRGEVPNPIGARMHFIHPQSLRGCSEEGWSDGDYECRNGKLWPLWALPEYADQEPMYIGITLFS
jgi:hypothetical protein